MADFKNYFTFSSSVDNLLFENVSVSSNAVLHKDKNLYEVPEVKFKPHVLQEWMLGMFGLCIGVAFFTIVYEVVKSLRHYLVILQMKSKDSSSTIHSEGRHSSLFRRLNPSLQKTIERLKYHCLQTLLHMLQLTMGYMLMLIIMSYNAWFIVTVIICTALCFYFHEYILSRKSMIVPVEIPGSNL